MKTSRRAASNGTVTTIRLLIGVLGSGLVIVLAALGAVVVTIARRVIVPGPRQNDTQILDVDVRAQTLRLSRTPDTELPGRYGLFTVGTESYVKLGSVLAEDESTVTRKLLTHIDDAANLAHDAAFSGWYYDHPEQLNLPWQPELIASSIGPCPAWIFPGGDTWAIQVHGRGGTRAECLRAVPLFHAAGMTSLVVSYRNDGEAPASRTGTYTLGDTEWRDVEAAIGYAKRHGARRIVLMGWSMGGAIALQAASRSAYRELIAGVVLESPVVDWKVVLEFQARLNHIPEAVGDLAVAALGQDWTAKAVGASASIPFDRLDMVANADALSMPILILHSSDDGFVPADASLALAAARPDIVTLEQFTHARHAKLWNYDQARFDRAITTWLAGLDG